MQEIQKKNNFPIVIPHVRWFSEQFRRIFKKYNIPPYFKPTNTLRQFFVYPEDKRVKERVVSLV